MEKVLPQQEPTMKGPRIRTSKNDPELARKIDEMSQLILERNYELYKRLENK
ncbi:MAG: hypothetical protein HUJ85_03040 [Veillonella sp.]|nr:hypothetical protein [Veillonella sp.]